MEGPVHIGSRPSTVWVERRSLPDPLTPLPRMYDRGGRLSSLWKACWAMLTTMSTTPARTAESRTGSRSLDLRLTPWGTQARV